MLAPNIFVIKTLRFLCFLLCVYSNPVFSSVLNYELVNEILFRIHPFIKFLLNNGLGTIAVSSILFQKLTIYSGKKNLIMTNCIYGLS